MKLEELKIIEQLPQFLDDTQAVIFKLDTVKKKRYQWILAELSKPVTLTFSSIASG